MKTKEELAVEYLACTSAESIADVKRSMMDQLSMLDPVCAKRLGLWFDRALADSMQRLAKFLCNEFAADELQYLIDVRKHPISQRMDKLAPQVMQMITGNIQDLSMDLFALLDDPEKLENLPS